MRDGVGRGRSKKSKPILTSPHGAGLKSCPIFAPPPLRGGENLHRGEARRDGSKRGGEKLPSLLLGNILYPIYIFVVQHRKL